MRLKHQETFLCFYLFTQLTFATQKNDISKNYHRTNPKKYYTTSAPISTTIKPRDTFSLSTNSDVKIRHSSSKFPHFDKLKTRIANLDRTPSVTGVESRTSSNIDPFKYRDVARNRFSDVNWNSDSRYSNSAYYPKIRHTAHGWSNRLRTTTTTTTTTTISPDDDLFDTYGDLEEENNDDDGDGTEDEDASYEDEDIFDTLDDDNDDTENNSFQAEEPTQRPTPEPRKYSSLSEFKWVQYGTKNAVEEARNRHLNLNKNSEENKARAALDHFVKVRDTGLCRKPSPKVISVQNEYPNGSIIYTPHCTVLNRCAEDTGCCKDHHTSCQYKEREQVHLYFYVTFLNGDRATVEKLTFYNHTSCECREIENTPTTTTTTERWKRIATLGFDNGEQKDSILQKNTDESATTENGNERGLGAGWKYLTNVAGKGAAENLEKKCKCPKVFTPKLSYRSKCYCDCNDEDEDCLRMKKGKEYFGLKDRLCIINSQCGTVQCEYGVYLKGKGRCPRINET